ncbi:MAG: hypothetical protein A2580_13355 [Hydrogenophilales bacterium RIFOXYD1_FULL_62_11]|nr:MAG: hypothetical protein A2580_13355 [Hydrogenophilales bacterium RIFOXYD1_FULL_62_11]
MSNPALKTVQVQSDTRTLMHALSKTFASNQTVLSELLQNTRRARATLVDITLTEDLIVIQDNGIGIDDLSLLLNVAKSGWDEAIQASDLPYGIGWLSALFSCKAVGVMSKGQHLYAMTADLLNLKPAAVNESVDLGVTEIRLHNYTIGTMQEVSNALQKIVKGFPVEVRLNGVPLERPHAEANTTLVDTSIGKVSPAILRGESVNQVYLQGLPVSARFSTLHSSSYSAGNVIHLDSTQFEGRAPDRDVLINPVEAGKRIRTALHAQAVEELTAISAQMEPAKFVETYAELAINLGMRDTMNSIDFIPVDWVREFDSLPYRTQHCSDNMSSPWEYGKVISKEQLVERGVYSIEDERSDYSTDLISSHVAHARRGFDAVGIPNWHWAHDLIQDLNGDSFYAQPGKELGRDEFDGRYFAVTLVVVETLHAVPMGEDADRDDIPDVVDTAGLDGISCYYDEEGSTLYVTPDVCSEIAVRQVSDYLTPGESEDDSAIDEDGTKLHSLRSSLINQDPEELFNAVVRDALPYHCPALLHGQTFQVVFDASGKFTVEQVALPA